MHFWARKWAIAMEAERKGSNTQRRKILSDTGAHPALNYLVYTLRTHSDQVQYKEANAVSSLGGLSVWLSDDDTTEYF